MRTRTTLLLLLVAGGLLAYIFFYDMHRPGTRVAAVQEAFVWNFPPDGIDGITIDDGRERIELRKEGVRWEVRRPVKDDASPEMVGQLLALSGALRKENTLPPEELTREAYREFGVDKGRLKLELHGKGAPPPLWFGKETAVEGKGYVRVEGEAAVDIVDNTLRHLIKQPADDFRDRRLTDIEGPHVERLTIRTKQGEIELVRHGENWELHKPLKARAGEQAVTDLIRSLLHTEILAFIPEKGANLNAFGLSEPRAVVTLQASSHDEPVRLEIGASKEVTDNGETAATYARLSTRHSLYELPQRIERILTLKPNDLRDRHLLRLQLDVVDRIRLQRDDSEALHLRRENEERWVDQEDPSLTFPAAKVAAMVEALTSAQAVEFVSQQETDLARYGLDQPSLKITFSSYASHTTAESGAGEEAIATLLFGAVRDGLLYAKLEEEPLIVAFDPSLLEAVGKLTTPDHDLALFDFAPEEVVALALIYPETIEPGETAPRQPISLVRDEAGWKLTAGSGVLDTVHLESFVNTLAKLSALRWLPTQAAKKAQASDKAAQTILWKTRDGTQYRMDLRPAPEEGNAPDAPRTLGTIDRKTGAFLISLPDESALRLPLITPPGVSPSPQESLPPAPSTPAPAPPAPAPSR
ncbi:MAG TPA: DUF4340 domain-containing protein [Chthoniobacteraceae bacterium]|nr:DUF4340 domain-containing protein [Chthoniobacteraceae bacterium]